MPLDFSLSVGVRYEIHGVQDLGVVNKFLENNGEWSWDYKWSHFHNISLLLQEMFMVL